MNSELRKDCPMRHECGSCAYSVQYVGHFGNSKSYVECKNPELQATQRRKDHPLTAVRARATKGCKRYKPEKE